MQALSAACAARARAEPRLARLRLARAVGDQQCGRWAGCRSGCRVMLWAAFASFISMAHLSADLAPDSARRRQGQDRGDARASCRASRASSTSCGRSSSAISASPASISGLTFVPAMIASLPVLFILAWMSNAFDARTPAAGPTVPVTLAPADRPHPAARDLAGRRQGGARRRRGPGTSPGRPTAAPLGSTIPTAARCSTLPTAAPVRTVHQREWWNSLIGNPGGYLPTPGDVAAVAYRPAAADGDPVRPGLAARLAPDDADRPGRACHCF